MNDPIVDYLKSLNPTKEQQAILIYDREYHLWREGKYLGIATWRKDDNVGDSFQRNGVNDTGEVITSVFSPDKWELIIKN